MMKYDRNKWISGLKNLGVILLFFSFAVTFEAAAEGPQNYRQAKIELRDHVYFDRNRDVAPGSFYCGCEWEWTTRSGGDVDASSCGYQVRKQPHRGERIEYEHVVPAYNFGRARQCWQKGGRSHCRDTDATFRAMEADMFNLVISVGELNADRSNFRYGQLSDTVHQHGACPFKVDFKQRVVEPRETVRGFIARTQFYMHDRYNLRMSEQQQRLFMVWDKTYPPSQWERRRHDRIAKIMGHTNPFLTGEASWSLNHDNRGAGVRDESLSQSDVDGVIRGNRNSKVYHLPEGCPSYTRVSEHNIVPFDTKAQAEAAGYRMAGNCR